MGEQTEIQRMFKEMLEFLDRNESIEMPAKVLAWFIVNPYKEEEPNGPLSSSGKNKNTLY